MNTARRLLITLAFALTLLMTCGLTTATAKTTIPAAKPADMRKLIKSVNAKDGTVDILYVNSKLVHTYRLDISTAIKVNNVPGKIEDIKAGMEVTDYLERDNDDLDGITLEGYGATPAAPAPKPAPKPKPKPAATT